MDGLIVAMKLVFLVRQVLQLLHVLQIQQVLHVLQVLQVLLLHANVTASKHFYPSKITLLQLWIILIFQSALKNIVVVWTASNWLALSVW